MSLPIFIDIDGTLTTEPTKKWGPVIESRIQAVRDMIARGQSVVLWTGGGEEYAKAFADKYGINAPCIGKPCAIVDDNQNIRPPGRMALLTPDWLDTV